MKKDGGILRIAARIFLFSIKIAAFVKTTLACILFLLICDSVTAQTCTLINTVAAKPPTSGVLDMLVGATKPGYYSVLGTNIYDSYDINGHGDSTAISPSNLFWINYDANPTGPLNRCGVWGQSDPKTLGFSVCINLPADKTYYMGFAADNSGTLNIDGQVVLKGIGFYSWGIYKISLTPGKHLVEFKVNNLGGNAALGFEIYDNTKDQIINATSTSDLNIAFSTQNQVGAAVQEGDPETSYSCPVGYTPDYCTSAVPVCTHFTPFIFNVINPAPICPAVGADITNPHVTAGNTHGITYSYWKDDLATVPLAAPDKITTSGTYYIMGTLKTCSAIKPVTVVIKAIDTTLTVAICQGDNFMGHTKSGTYLDTLTASTGCDSVVTTNLTVKKPSLGPDRNLCFDDTFVLAPGPGPFTSFLWQDSSTMPTFTVTQAGTYWVKVTYDIGCSASDTVVVKVIGCLPAVIPNTFTPNGDGINDTWNVKGLEGYTNCTVYIYTRWGQLVFKSKGYPKPWDGRSNGQNLPVGTYYYIIDLKNNAPPISGNVTIVR